MTFSTRPGKLRWTADKTDKQDKVLHNATHTEVDVEQDTRPPNASEDCGV